MAGYGEINGKNRKCLFLGSSEFLNNRNKNIHTEGSSDLEFYE